MYFLILDRGGAQADNKETTLWIVWAIKLVIVSVGEKMECRQYTVGRKKGLCIICLGIPWVCFNSLNTRGVANCYHLRYQVAVYTCITVTLHFVLSYLRSLFFKTNTDVVQLQLFLFVLSGHSLLMDLQLLHLLCNLSRQPQSPVLLSPAHLSLFGLKSGKSKMWVSSSFLDCLHHHSKWVIHKAIWPGLVLLDRSRIRGFLDSWKSIAGVKNQTTLALKQRESTGLLCNE